MWKDVFHRMFDLTRSNYSYERLGVILAIGELSLFTLLTIRRQCVGGDK